MKHVFVSYKHDDHDFVEVLRGKLQASGLATWADTDIQPGEEWKPAIDNAIRDSFAVVVVMTPVARESEFVTYEWSYAMGLGKEIVPIVLKLTELHPKLSDLQFLKFLEPSNRPWDLLQKRLETLRTKAGRSQSEIVKPPKPPVKHADLIKDLESSKPKAREAAARVLGTLKAYDAIPKLISLAQDEDEAVRLTSVEALGELGRDEAIPALMAIADRSDLGTDTQQAAIRAISRIGSRRALTYLYKRFLEKPDNEELISALIYAVGNHNVSTLNPQTLDGLQELARDEVEEFRSRVQLFQESLQAYGKRIPIPADRLFIEGRLRVLEAQRNNLVHCLYSLRILDEAKSLRDNGFSTIDHLLMDLGIRQQS